MEKRTSKVSSRKIRGLMKPQAPRRAKRRKTRNGRTTGCTAVYQWTTQHRPASNVARPGRAGWHSRAKCAGAGSCDFAVSRFRPFYSVFALYFGDFSQTFLRAFQDRIRVYLSLNKLHQGELDQTKNCINYTSVNSTLQISMISFVLFFLSL